VVHSLVRTAIAAMPLLAAAPALAQDDPEARPNDPNSLTIGLGGAYVPSYEGSDDYELTPIGVAFGKVSGFGFSTRGSGLAIDLIPDDPNDPWSFDFGPVAHVRLDRTSRIKDAQVRALGEIDTAVELGAWAGFKKNGLLHAYDTLSVRVTWQKDVGDTHDSALIIPAVDYETPLGERTYASLGLTAERAGDGYARTYFGVTPAGSVASGLPVYTPDGGWKNWRLSLILAQVLTGDLRDPGLSVFGGVAYSKLRGDFKRSPIVAIAGDSDQYFATLGLSYTF
jgi:outer membrane protein